MKLVSFRCDTSVMVIGDLVTSSGLHLLSCSALVTPCLVTHSSCDEDSALCLPSRPLGLAVLTQWGTSVFGGDQTGTGGAF